MQGPLMIFAMKLVCVIMSSGLPELSMFLHYCLSPSSAIFGPIIPFDEFRAKIFRPRFSISLRPLMNAVTGTFLTFITANCICQSVEWVYTGDDLPPYHVVSVGGV